MLNSVPDLPVKEIIDYLNDLNIDIRQSDILKPNNSILLRLYENILSIFTSSIINYELEESLYQIIIYKKMYNFLIKINFESFNIKDLNCDSRRLISILSYIVNYSMYRDTKKGIYEKISQMNTEKNILKEDIEKKIKNKEKEIKKYKDQINQQLKNKENLEAEISELDNEIKEIVKNQRNLVSETEKLKMERDEYHDKLNSYQLLVMNLKQENECLKTQIVSDPTKLVSLLKEMKELLNKEHASLKNLEKDNCVLNNKLSYFMRSKEEIKNLIIRSNEIKKFYTEIEEIENFLSSTSTNIKNIESTINANKIRYNYILRQISHIESKIGNLQENDKKCTDEIYNKMDKLKDNYENITRKRNDIKNMIQENIKMTKQLEYEIIKIKNEHKCYINDIVNILNNIKDNQGYYFSTIKRNL